jgi:hypothetical protein
MIYSIGYQRLAPARLVEIATGLDALVIDFRGKPVSRNASYRMPALERLLGRRYLWMGDTLSGPMHGAGVLPEGIIQLRRLAAKAASSSCAARASRISVTGTSTSAPLTSRTRSISTKAI